MQTNPYRAKLQRELDSLIKRKIGLRKLLSSPFAFYGDSIDQIRGMERAQIELRAAEMRHAELRHLLGLPEPTGPVKLDAPVRTTSTSRGAVKITPVRRDLQAELRKRGMGAGGYIKKVMRAD
jgi:hypothetical protein